jgi:hypothetical protein
MPKRRGKMQMLENFIVYLFKTLTTNGKERTISPFCLNMFVLAKIQFCSMLIWRT